MGNVYVRRYGDMCVPVGNVSLRNYSRFVIEVARISQSEAVINLQQNFLKCELIKTFHIQEDKSCNACYSKLGPKHILPSKIKSKIASLCPA